MTEAADATANPTDPEDEGVIWDDDIYPNLYEHRIPDCGAPYP